MPLSVNSDPAIDMRAAIRHPVTPTSQPTPRLLETPATPEARDSTSTEIYDVPGGLTSNASRISVDATPTAPLPRPSSSNGDSLSPSERSQVNSALSEGADSGISESRIEEDYDVPRCDMVDQQQYARGHLNGVAECNSCKQSPHTPHSHSPNPHTHPHPHAHLQTQSPNRGYANSTGTTFATETTPTPPPIKTIPHTRPFPSFTSCSQSTSSLTTPRISPTRGTRDNSVTVHYAQGELKRPSVESPLPSGNHSVYSTPTAKTDHEEQLELLCRLGEFAKRSCSRLMSAYRLPSSSRSTALYDLQMACVAVRKCANDFVDYAGHRLPSNRELDELLAPNARHSHLFADCLTALDAVSWRFDRLTANASPGHSVRATQSPVDATAPLTGEQYISKMVDIAERLPARVDRLTDHVRRWYDEKAPPLPPVRLDTDTPSPGLENRSLPALPRANNASPRAQRGSRGTGSDRRWIDESDYIHFADARRQQSLDFEESRTHQRDVKLEQSKYVCTPTETPLVQLRASEGAPARNASGPAHNAASPSRNVSASGQSAVCSFNNAASPTNTTDSPTRNTHGSTHNSRSNTSTNRIRSTISPAHSSDDHTHSTPVDPARDVRSASNSQYHSTTVQPASQIYDLLPASRLNKLSVSFDVNDYESSLPSADNGTGCTLNKSASSLSGTNCDSAATKGSLQLSSGFERKLRAVKSFDDAPAAGAETGVTPTARAPTHATDSECAMLQHYAGQLARSLDDLRASSDRLLSDTVSGRAGNCTEALRHAHRLIYLSDAVSRRVVNLHELGARLSDYAAAMSVSLKTVDGVAGVAVAGVAVAGVAVAGDREKLLRAVEHIYDIAERITTLVTGQAEISSH